VNEAVRAVGLSALFCILAPQIGAAPGCFSSRGGRRAWRRGKRSERSEAYPDVSPFGGIRTSKTFLHIGHCSLTKPPG
jgi:hypothetical protein